MNLEKIVKSNSLRKVTRGIVKPILMVGTGIVAHEYIHGLTALALGGTFNEVTIDPLNEITCTSYPNPNSKYALLHQSIISLSPHLILGIPGIHIIKNEIEIIKSLLNNKENKFTLIPSCIYISAALGFYLTIPYGIGDIYGHGLGGGDFINATQSIRGYISNYNHSLMEIIDDMIPVPIQTFATVFSTFGLSFLSYLSGKKLIQGLNEGTTRYF